jgi:multimeric flavodoxin WrbA
MKRNLLILKASPRKNGNSTLLAERAADGAREAGATVESILLSDLEIHPCDGCDCCRGASEGCILQDDMQALYPKLLAAQALVLASPIYWFTYDAQLKLCIDRWYGLWNNHPDFMRGKPVGIILTYGDVDLYVSGGINAIHTFETMFRFLQAPIAGMVYGSVDAPGDVRKKPELMQAAYDLGKKVGKQLNVGDLNGGELSVYYQ